MLQQSYKFRLKEKMMSPKQEIYRNIFCWTLPYLRNVASRHWWQRRRDQSLYFKAELVHNLPTLMFEPEFTHHDIWFLNAQADWYIRNCSESISPLYQEQKKLLLALRSLVPEALRATLQQTDYGA
jgi:hypothetical protein